MELRNKFIFGETPFINQEKKDEFFKGLKVIEQNHLYFFNKRKNNSIESFIVPNNFLGKPVLGFRYEKELPVFIKNDLISLWNKIY